MGRDFYQFSWAKLLNGKKIFVGLTQFSVVNIFKAFFEYEVDILRSSFSFFKLNCQGMILGLNQNNTSKKQNINVQPFLKENWTLGHHGMWYRFQKLTGSVRHTCFCDSPEKQFAEQKTISI